jgi:hypothetical protein
MPYSSELFAIISVPICSTHVASQKCSQQTTVLASYLDRALSCPAFCVLLPPKTANLTDGICTAFIRVRDLLFLRHVHSLLHPSIKRVGYAGASLHTASTIKGTLLTRRPLHLEPSVRMSKIASLVFLSVASLVAAQDGYNLLGCYSDSSAARALHNFVGTSSTMTVETCMSMCFNIDGNGPVTLVGLEYGGECCMSLSSSVARAASCSLRTLYRLRERALE